MKGCVFLILTDEIINEIIKNNHKCTYVNDDYVILYKFMEVPDIRLEEYLNRISIAHKNGILISRVIDFKLLNKKEGNTSKGIFVEERAKGDVLNIRGMVLKTTQCYDFKSILFEYLQRVNQYLLFLEKRAYAPQEMYDKFLSDYISLYHYGLRPDPNSLNYLFDSNIGFTIIDPYLYEMDHFPKEPLFGFIMNAVYGVGRPSILVKSERLEAFYDLPIDLKLKLEKYSENINKKIAIAFKKQNYSNEYIINELEKNKMRYFVTDGVYLKDDLINRLEDFFVKEKRL